jgi:hypothetical protein
LRLRPILGSSCILDILTLSLYGKLLLRTRNDAARESTRVLLVILGCSVCEKLLIMDVRPLHNLRLHSLSSRLVGALFLDKSSDTLYRGTVQTTLWHSRRSLLSLL